MKNVEKAQGMTLEEQMFVLSIPYRARLRIAETIDELRELNTQEAPIAELERAANTLLWRLTVAEHFLSQEN